MAKSLHQSNAPAVEEGYPEHYPDGRPLDEITYIEAKIILHGERFVSVRSFFDFSRIMCKAAKATGVDFDGSEVEGVRPLIREVLFLDTRDFALYNSGFILRRRTHYEDGFPTGDPELVCKFRHPDRTTATLKDMRPHVPGDYRIKFKEELLPLKDRLGGIRTLYSHTVDVRGHASAIQDEQSAAHRLASMFPVLEPVFSGKREHVQLVNRTAVEEVLQPLGRLDFGKGVYADSNVSVWRARGDQRQLVGEFSYQMRFERRADLNAKAVERSNAFFIEVQKLAKDWVSLGTTKTGVVYRLRGNPPRSHE